MNVRGDAWADGDDARASLAGGNRWWRSVGFWTGMWGLMFLVWLWVESFSYVPRVMSHVKVKGPNFFTGYSGWELKMERGMMVFHRGDVVKAARGVAFRVDAPGVDLEVLHQPRVRSTWWGSRRVEEIRASNAALVVEVREWWLSMGVVVAVYGVVWLGGLVMWRRWLKRRWKASRVVEVSNGNEVMG